MAKHVFLTGMMGSGKSTVGALVASMLQLPFVDLDREIEDDAGRALEELFREGEREFRQVEKRTLASVARRSPCVVATGGGALLDPSSMTLARAAGTIVYLRAPASALAGRLAGRNDRPLLLDDAGEPLSAEALLLRLESLLQERQPAYLQADLVVDVGDASTEEIALAVVAGLRSSG